MRHLAARLLVCLALTVLLAQTASEGAEWGVRFPFEEGAPRDRIELQLRPGETGKGVIELVNRSDTELSFELGASDAEYGADGRATAVTGDASTAGRWLIPATSRLQLAAHSELALDFSVKVPVDAHSGNLAAALNISQLATQVREREIPVERTIAVIVHIEVVGDESQLATTATPTGGALLPIVVAIGAVLFVLVVCVVLVRRRGRLHSQT